MCIIVFFFQGDGTINFEINLSFLVLADQKTKDKYLNNLRIKRALIEIKNIVQHF